MKSDTVYVAVEVKRTGPIIGEHSMLSLGACVILREEFPAAGTLQSEDYLFYAEIKPISLKYEIPRLRADAAQLGALAPKLDRPLFCPTNIAFDPRIALAYLQDTGACETPGTAIRRFGTWFRKVTHLKNGVGIIRGNSDVFGWINHCCGVHGGINPIFECGGVDLSSLWMGVAGRHSTLETTGVKDDRIIRHRADHDAIWLAKIARVVLYEKLDW